MHRYLAGSFVVLFVALVGAPLAAQESFQVLGGGNQTEPAAAGEVIPLPPEVQTVEQIYEFLDKLGEMEPAGLSEQEVIAHQKKIFRTVNQGVNKALTLEITEAQAMEGYFYKLQALQYLKQLGEPGATEQFNQAINAALADARPSVNDIGMKFHVESGLGMWSKLNDQQRNGLIDTIIAFVSRGKPDFNKVRMVMTIADEFLGNMSGGAPYAKRLLDSTIPLFKASGDEDLASAATLLEGIARRMSLPGNAMEVRGKLLDGTEFDWQAYRGKVVLVDFWASWCQPCLQELPNVLKHYKAYHEKGFDVVGINIDEKVEIAEAAVQKMNLPWATIYDHEEAMANHYGITGIPRAILVDQAGNVVSMMARGPYLERELRKLLGEPLAVNDEPIIDDAVEPASAEEERPAETPSE